MTLEHLKDHGNFYRKGTHIRDDAAYEAAITARKNAAANVKRHNAWLASEPRALEVLNFLNAYEPFDSSFWLKQSGSDFARSMREAIGKWGALTDGQTQAVIKMIDRGQERLESFKATEAAAGYVGTVGERLTVTLQTVWQKVYDGTFGETVVTGLRTEDGSTVIHRGSGSYKWAPAGESQTVTVTVKEHSTRDGRTQTIVTRPAAPKAKKEGK